MIRFEDLEQRLPELKQSFATAKPYCHGIIDNFADPEKLKSLLAKIPDPVQQGIGKSRDYVFARNKYEKSKFRNLSSEFEELYSDLISPRFQHFVSSLVGESIFIDPEFHGGGIHQGGEGSFLDMHVDFNYHPRHNNWFRNINALLYLNDGWKPEYGGQLKMQNKETGERGSVEPLFNRCVVMFTRDYTLHGYDSISFPKGKYRRSVAIYGYSLRERGSEASRSTTWYPTSGPWIKRVIGQAWPTLVKIKGTLLGSGTAKNR